ncbi:MULTISPECIES: hypothetical protein [unclassified Clostridium]|uniref:hypothetical protein n=1 Tax=unclassified Clostridium TaxID=2614128 RepID=UPI0011074507|nr:MULTISPECIES: hypothetical protein [unclassified Clostridium]
MRVYVKSPGSITLYLALPTRLVVNRVTLGILQRALGRADQPGVKISPEQAKRLLAVVRQAKKRYPRLELVDINTAQGEIVKIRL